MSEGTDVIQAVIVRKDLDWPMGAICSQVSHASNALWAQHGSDHPLLAQYTAEYEGMTTVVCGIATEEKLRNLAAKIAADETLLSHLWVEQPENIPSALAVIGVRDTVRSYTKRLKLL
ncbi:Peptidyl-tRNA hydrolase, PTH2 [Carpediemonas membranifera]|uniref:peptidyl-tRNA hydrolase n=1 Tax=Carpediemonas membranifera TaxID=201153 RepID=A0A8J6AZY4_9EUKA|nr:Peptidyl-tRNA hydrolase, PTH2 [Carpediemonas membranifera]|eukprot:KAG9396350.1 Peptidyl-tRNA hydrolase, PTH2 [Carpediemonas membranifera]